MASNPLVEKAKLAEQAERYEDMSQFMKELAESEHTFAIEERNLLSVAYKNVVGTKRSAWRVLTALESKEEANSEKLSLIREYKKIIQGELTEVCGEVVKLLDKLNTNGDSENEVFYKKMEGDYYRYLAEMNTDEKDDHVAKSEEAYKKAYETAKEKLVSTNPIRLGLALNFSVFHYEIKNKPDDATKLAKAAFDDAISEMDGIKDDSYKDSTLIMQLLRDNLALWTSGDEEDDDQ